MDWGKPQKIIASIVGAISIMGSIFFVYNFFAKQEDHEELVQEVREQYAKQEELVAVNKNVQQTNYQFWVYQLKQTITELYDKLRVETDPIEKQRIKDTIEELKQDLKDYKQKLNDLK